MSDMRFDMNGDSVPMILVVEDDLSFLSFMVAELEEYYQVVTATNGRLGLKQAVEHLPDLVITDLMMPVMGGGEMVRELKSGVETSHIPVMMLTARDSLESEIEGLETGADDYITKPFVIEVLLAKVRNRLASRRALRERFSREFFSGGRTDSVPAGGRAFLERAAGIVKEHLSEPDFKPEDFASYCGLGLRSLQRKLKAVADLTPARFINEVRMAEAARLLVNSSFTITEIAFEVGACDPGNFARIFRQHFDLSPSQYRTAHHPE